MSVDAVKHRIGENNEVGSHYQGMIDIISKVIYHR